MDEPFASYMIDSREALHLSADLEEWVGIKLPETILWDNPTIEALAADVLRRFDERG